MVCVGIDVAKDKHDCCILDSDGMVRADCFTIPNNMDGFKQLLQTIRNCTQKSDKIKVGLEATGHYSYNILGFLLDKDLAVYVMNPLHTNLYRKSLSLRKTKTDRVDARTIAMIAVAFEASAVFVEIGKTLGVDLGITTLLGFFVLASLLVEPEINITRSCSRFRIFLRLRSVRLQKSCVMN